MNAMEQNNSKQPKRTKDRIGMILSAVYVLSLVAAVVVAGRILQIQWFWNIEEDIEKYFVPNSTRNIIEPERGKILGYDGKLLAMSTPIYQLYMDCTVRKDYFKGKENGEELEREWLDKARQFSMEAADELGVNGSELYGRISAGRRNGRKYLKIGNSIDRSVLDRLKTLPLMNEGQYRSGIIITKKDTRQYPYGKLARRTIGYVKDNSNSNGNNKIGLEGKYDYALHGKEGQIWLRPTDNKDRIRNYDSTYVKPEDGQDIRSTIDITLQEIADKALRKQIEENMAIDMGCAVIMEVETGAIRAMVNLNRDKETQKMEETMNMAIGMAMEPGSVFKTTTLMTAIEDGHVRSLDDRIPTNDGYIKGYAPDDHVRGMKDISILHGFEISSNYVFRYLAVEHYSDDPKKFLDKLYSYKLGQDFDFDLNGLVSPSLPDPNSKSWSATDLGSVGIGYAVKETPLHILMFYNAIANKGRMMKPYLVESIEADGAVKTKKGPSVLNASICSKATADTLLRALKSVTSEGTATRLKGAKLQVAGKTGTSRQVLTAEDIKEYGMQTPYVTKDGSYHNLATFVGFFPADAPKYSAIICVKSGLIRGSVYGGVIPAAAMREIVDAIYTLNPSWGAEYSPAAEVPSMARDSRIGAPANLEGSGERTVPDLKGLGLKDAVYVAENEGFKCTWSGAGHVAAQNPPAGSKANKGTTLNIELK